MPVESLFGKRIVVIGGSSGIGFAVAQAAAGERAEIVIGSSRPARVEAAVGRLGILAEGTVIDVTSEASVAAFFEKIGAYDHLVITAGDWDLKIGSSPAVAVLDDLRDAMTVRIFGVVSAIKYGSRQIAQDGSITLTGGTLAYRPQKGAWFGTPIAGAIKHMTYGLAVELAPVRVNAVSPGFILNALEDERSSLNEKRLAANQAKLDRQPIGRAGWPDEVAQAYLYLMRGGYTTGQVINVDGGHSII